MHYLRFPAKFAWGVAAAAPQIEGAASADGKGPSIWDVFCRVDGAVHNRDTPERACDHYRTFESDFALMRELGVKHYRMSLAWPRIFPQGRGTINRAGIDFYHRVFESLERNGIEPWVTMFHWDLPQALEDEGGWRGRGTVDAFAAYADTIVREYRDHVRRWITVNEIFCFTKLGYGTGQKAPGARESEAVVNQTYHHALIAHGHGVRAVREHGGRRARVGFADNPTVSIPLDATKRDIGAAKRTFVTENIRVLDPVFRGRYAEEYLRESGAAAPTVARGDFKLISLPIDFIGLNIYTGKFVRQGRSGPETVPFTDSFPRSDCSWQHLVPQALYWGPRFFTELYGPLPIYITEHGAGYNEPASVKGEMADVDRRECLRSYLRELAVAIRDGSPVKGCFLWTFMDNFEWEDGYERRFGIVHNNFETQVRQPKLSARWYSEVMRTNRVG